MTLKIGSKCPEFELPASDGTTFNSKDWIGHKPFILFFYPKADTPGCTLEACGFSDAITRYRKRSTSVFGISPDSLSVVKAFAEKFRLKIPLLADGDHSVCETFGVWIEKQMMGNTYMGAARTTFIVGKNGQVVQIFEKVDPKAQHDEQVLSWLDQNLT